MTEIKNNTLNESYSLITADCGLKIGVYNMPGYNAVHAVFATNFGSVDREFSMDGKRYKLPAGVAHFLEHKMFENEECDAFERYAKTGASANAFTSFDKTCYIFTATENIDESLDILLDFVTKPYFTEQTVQKEMGIIGQELIMFVDSANWWLLFGILDGLYVNHPIKEDIAGTVDSIARINAPMLYDVCKAFYSPAEMMLCVAGNITADRVAAAVKRAGFDSDVSDVKRIYQNEPDEINKSYGEIYMPVSTPIVALGYKEKMSDPVTVKEELCGEIIMNVLTGATSKLFNKLYDMNIVNGTFEGEIFSGRDYYSSIISGETNRPDTLIDEIEKAIKELKETGIGEEDFTITKNSIYGSMIMSFENVEEVATEMANAHFKGGNLYTAMDTLAALTLDDVNSQLKNMMRDDKKSVFKVLPLEDVND